MTGCGLQQIKPAIDANSKNIKDLTKYTAEVAVLLEKVSHVLWQDEIEYRRTIVLDHLQKLGSILGAKPGRSDLKGQNIMDAFKDDAALHSQYNLVAMAMSAAHEPADQVRLEKQYPVLSAYILAKVSPETIADDINKLFQTANQPEVARRPIRNGISDHYPYVQKAHVAQKETAGKLSVYRELLEKELKLANSHANFFVYAAESDANIKQAFMSILGLEQEVLGLIDDGTSKEIAGEAFAALRDLLKVKSPEALESSSE
jgi:hypothetical protein